MGILVSLLGGFILVQALKQTWETFSKEKNLSNQEFFSEYGMENNLNFLLIALSLIFIIAGLLIFKYT
ncbi:MAG: hypothetical protein KBC12_02890 [Candidatus Pacebacteria bacterium]|nr:hypothetical protein [Candidatus Paceibacterota bacterium]MBP9851387.1 hypothetical protein [Candidatus Paceibacterota bacterium]